MSRPPEPQHLTEFASERYFTKLHQQAESSSREENVVEGPSLAVQSSQFILPIGRPKSADHEAPAAEVKGKEKRNFLRKVFSSKAPVLPPALPVSPATEPDVPRASTTSESASRKSPVFDELFLSLPNELQVQIVCSLPLRDILNLRLASKSLHRLISFNEGPIVRYHLDHHVPAYAKRLYPLKDVVKVDLHYLCGIWHRLHVAAKLSYLMCEWITKEIFLRTTDAQQAEFAPQRERMRRRLIPLVFTAFHFFETYRNLHLKYLTERDGHGLLREPYTMNPIELQILSMYDDQTLLRVHQVFPLIVSSFCRRLRPPSYVGRVERAVRGYIRDRPPDEVHVAILCLGGLRQVEEFWMVKGYNSRRLRVDAWYNTLTTPEPPKQSPPKPRRGLMGLGRKKSMAALKDGSVEVYSVQALCNTGEMQVRSVESGDNIFNTSLSAGMPMAKLPDEHARILLSDLPILQQIWMVTAEALILEKKIVERAIDIKRNAQVMLDLIREDGAAEEDEWLYGSGSPESVTPQLASIEEEDDQVDGL